MKWSLGLCFITLIAAQTAHGQYAVEVLSYDGGTNPAGYSTASSALGSPERFTGEGVFPGEVTVFNPAFGTDELVSIGETGHLTLRLSHFAIPGAGAEIGVFTHVGIADENYPNGQAGNPLFVFGIDSATVEVSADGIHWESLGVKTFDIPTQGYNDIPGTIESNFQHPFAGALSDFNGLPLTDPANPNILELLAGSGGGTWLDISATPLAKVGYVRFSVAAGVGESFELDAVAVAALARGGRVPEPTALALVGLSLLASVLRRNRR
jgi:hypothetical protein